MLKRPYLQALIGRLLVTTILLTAAPDARAAEPDHHRLRHGADRRTGAERQGGAAGDADVGRVTSTPKAACWAGRLSWSIMTTSPTRRLFPASTQSCWTWTKSIWWSAAMATNMIAPALPVIMQHNRTFLGLFGLAVNSEFNYPNYFSIVPTGGPHPKQAFAKGFFEVAMAQNPKPRRSRLPGPMRSSLTTRWMVRAQLAKEAGLKIVYDRSYPPTTNDYSPIVRGDSGGQSGHGVRRVLSAGYRRHSPSGKRDRTEGEAVRRRHGRIAVDRDQDPAWPADERHRRLRLLAAPRALWPRRKRWTS